MAFVNYLDTTLYLTNFAIITLDQINSSPPISMAYITQSLSASSAIVDSYISEHYITPLTVIPPDVQMFVAKLTDYDLVCRKGYNTEEEVNSIYRDRRNDAMESLKLIKDGELILGGQLIPTIDSTANYIASVNSYAAWSCRR